MPFLRLKPLPDFSTAAVSALRRDVDGHPLLRLYLAAALAAGGRDRLAVRTGSGGLLGIDFEGQRVLTGWGVLPEQILADVCRFAGMGEFHLPEAQAEVCRRLLGPRLLADLCLRFYHRPIQTGLLMDPRCRRVGPQDLAVVQAFYQAHYPQTIFSRWMLDSPFVGLFSDGELLACGGVVVAAACHANIGNILIRPDHRGKGVGRVLVSSLLAVLAGTGFSEVSLGTTADNIAACRLYESLGFQCFEERRQLEVAAAQFQRTSLT